MKMLEGVQVSDKETWLCWSLEPRLPVGRGFPWWVFLVSSRKFQTDFGACLIVASDNFCAFAFCSLMSMILCYLGALLTCQKQFKSSYEESNTCKNWFDWEKGERRQSKFSLAFKNVFHRAAVWKLHISAEPKPLQTSKSDLEISNRWVTCMACWQRANFYPHYMVTPRYIRE